MEFVSFPFLAVAFVTIILMPEMFYSYFHDICIIVTKATARKGNDTNSIQALSF